MSAECTRHYLFMISAIIFVYSPLAWIAYGFLYFAAGCGVSALLSIFAVLLGFKNKVPASSRRPASAASKPAIGIMRGESAGAWR
jgi:hypothetical protein